MKSFNKKIVSIIVLMSMLLSLVATGCSSKKEEEDLPDSDFSRSDFIGMLASEFGYNDPIADSAFYDDVTPSDEYYTQIQACAEYEIIDTDAAFKPGKAVTLEFAVESTVKAIGLNRLSRADVYSEGEDLVDFFNNNIANLGGASRDTIIDASTAYAIITNASDYDNNLVMPQSFDIEVKEDVIEVDSGVILYDDYTGEFSDGITYNPGDILYIHSETGMSRGVKILNVNGVSFSYEDAALEDTLDSISISGSYEAVVIDAVSSCEDTDLEYSDDFLAPDFQSHDFQGKDARTSAKNDSGDSESAPAPTVVASVSTEHTRNSVSFTANLSGSYNDGAGTASAVSGTFTAEITNIGLDFNYDHKFLRPLSPTDVSVGLHFNTKVQSNITGSISKNVKLGQMDVAIPNTPITIRFTLKALIAADGSVTITYTSTNLATVGWHEGRGFRKDFDHDESLDVEAKAKITGEITAGIHLRIGWGALSAELCNVSLTTGAVGIVEAQADLLHDDVPDCIDLLVYVPLRVGINLDGCLLVDILGDKAKKEWTIWDASNSAIQSHWHFEDHKDGNGLIEVDACTRGEGQEVVEDPVDEDGNVMTEYDVFDFTGCEYAFIHIANPIIHIAQNTCGQIEITSYPAGVDASNIVTITEDGSVCTTSGLTITAVGPGSTTVVVQSADGTYKTKVAVTVYDNYDVEFDPF